MDSIPFVVLFLPYAVILLISALFLFFNVFHLWRYGVESMSTRLLILAYIGIFTLAVGGTLVALGGYSLDSSFSLSDILPSTDGVSSFGL
jgi:hypothetical protein